MAELGEKTLRFSDFFWSSAPCTVLQELQGGGMRQREGKRKKETKTKAKIHTKENREGRAHTHAQRDGESHRESEKTWRDRWRE